MNSYSNVRCSTHNLANTPIGRAFCEVALVLVLALLTVLLSGCALALFGAGAGAGYVITHELDDESGLESELREDTDVVWLAAIESLDILHDLNTDVVVQDSPRQAQAVVDGREIILHVDAYDLNRTILRVQARGPLGADEKAARRILKDIVARLQR